ncbi:ribonuclease H-like domain-containing protein [Tanacetum coccineum]
MWLFKHKFHADGTLSRYKARLVANGSSQQLGVDFDETFSAVVKPATIHTVLSLVVSCNPLDLLDSQYPHHVCILQRSLYGLKQAPRAWFQRFAASSPTLLQQIIDSLHSEFDMTDLGAPNYFLGISVVHHPTGLFLSQRKYALHLLERAHMVNCNPSRTPVDTESKLDPEGVPFHFKILLSEVFQFELLKFLQCQLFRSLEDWEVSLLQFMQRYRNGKRLLKVYKTGKRLLYVKRNKAISLEKVTVKPPYLVIAIIATSNGMPRTMAGVDVDTLSMEQYLALSAKRWVDRLALRTINTRDLFKKAFIQRYCPPSMTVKQLEDIYNFKQEGDESLYQAWEWNIRSSNSKDGLATLVNKLDNLRRDMKKLKESVHAIQAGCQICKGPHLDKDYPLNEEVKQVEEVRYREFGRTTPFNGNNRGRQILAETIKKYIKEASMRQVKQDEWLKTFFHNLEKSQNHHEEIIQGLKSRVTTLAKEAVTKTDKNEDCKAIFTNDETPL